MSEPVFLVRGAVRIQEIPATRRIVLIQREFSNRAFTHHLSATPSLAAFASHFGLTCRYDCIFLIRYGLRFSAPSLA
jgi:hypothetical protein